MTRDADDSKVNVDSELEPILVQIRQIVAEVGGREIGGDTRDLVAEGLDSMARLDILAMIEERFGIELNESEIGEFKTILRISRVVHNTIRLLAS